GDTGRPRGSHRVECSFECNRAAGHAMPLETVPQPKSDRRTIRTMFRALCALVLLCSAWSPVLADETKPVTAIFLVARAELPDANFKDSIVLVTNQTRVSPIGVIINKPTRIRVAQLFPDMENLAELEDKIYFGGPVDSRAVSFIFRAAKPPDEASEIFD